MISTLGRIAVSNSLGLLFPNILTFTVVMSFSTWESNNSPHAHNELVNATKFPLKLISKILAL